MTYPPAHEMESGGSQTLSGMVAVVGRANVGKSSLGNVLLKSKRLIVSNVPGTTRDAVKVDIEYKKGENVIPFRLVDTAGLRAKKKIKS